MHTITAIYDQDFYNDLFRGSRFKTYRKMWLKKRVLEEEDI